MNLCQQELKRCQNISPKPNFIFLLGDRYGWRPLPAQVDAKEFASLCHQMNERDEVFVRRWYKQDDNAVPGGLSASEPGITKRLGQRVGRSAAQASSWD